MPLITHEQLQLATGFSKGITEEKTLRYRMDAETYDLPTLLSGNLITDVRAFNITPTEWANDVAFLSGAYGTYGNIYYKALSDTTGVIPGTDAAIWEPDYKATLRYTHLPDFLIWSAARRFRTHHGKNYTEAGFTVSQDPENTYQPGSDKSRAEEIQEATDKSNFHRAQIEGFLNKYELITRNSCEPVRRRGNGRITAL